MDEDLIWWSQYLLDGKVQVDSSVLDQFDEMVERTHSAPVISRWAEAEFQERLEQERLKQEHANALATAKAMLDRRRAQKENIPNLYPPTRTRVSDTDKTPGALYVQLGNGRIRVDVHEPVIDISIPTENGFNSGTVRLTPEQAFELIKHLSTHSKVQAMLEECFEPEEPIVNEMPPPTVDEINAAQEEEELERAIEALEDPNFQAF